MNDFCFFRLRVTYLATQGELRWRAGEAANRIRGGLGLALARLGCEPECVDKDHCPGDRKCFYGRVFAPQATDGPSGLKDPPRPFVVRAAHLDNSRTRRGERFAFGLHLFDLGPGVLEGLCLALAELAEDVRLVAVDALGWGGESQGMVWQEGKFPGSRPKPLCLVLEAKPVPVRAVEVAFRTPTEVKGWADPTKPDFAPLVARIRDRVSTLRAFYGEGPLNLDFTGLAERARQVELKEARMQRAQATRRSGRTGERHSLGGWTGWARYEGELGEYLPWLEAGEICGVGRQTVWGKGEIGVRALSD